MPVITDPALRVSISLSNNKTRTASISLPPGPEGTCRKDVKCWGPDLCYAWKMYQGWGYYRNVKQAWDRNLAVYEADPLEYFGQVKDFLNDLSRKSEDYRYFRWHVGGECPDEAYVRDLIETAWATPLISHTLYTKQYDWWLKVAHDLPVNLAVMFSGWPGMELPEQDRFPVKWMLDPKDPDPRIPKDVDLCPGSCPECRWCWDPGTPGCAIHKH